MERIDTSPLNGYAILVHFPDAEVGQNENIFIAALAAKKPDDASLENLKKVLLKYFPELEKNISVAEWTEINKTERLLFFDGYFLDEPNHPILSEKKAFKIFSSEQIAA